MPLLSLIVYLIDLIPSTERLEDLLEIVTLERSLQVLSMKLSLENISEDEAL